MAERKPKLSHEEYRTKENAYKQAYRARKRIEAGLPPTKPKSQKKLRKDILAKTPKRLPTLVQDLSTKVKIVVKSMNMTVYAKPGTTEADIIEKYSRKISKF